MPVGNSDTLGDALAGNIFRLGEGSSLAEHRSVLLQLRQAMTTLLPDGWFELHSLGDTNFDQGYDHIMLDRVGGPPIGSFHVWRLDGQIYLRRLPELDQAADETPWTGCFHDIQAAAKAIRGAIEQQLQAWTLSLYPTWGGVT